MIDIPGIYVGRFKDDPNQSTMLMKTNDTPTYTDDNWANVESTGTIWRYSSEAGEWIDTGLEEILVEEISGTKEIVAEGTVPWKLQGLNAYGKSTQQTTTGAQLLDIKRFGKNVMPDVDITPDIPLSPLDTTGYYGNITSNGYGNNRYTRLVGYTEDSVTIDGLGGYGVGLLFPVSPGDSFTWSNTQAYLVGYHFRSETGEFIEGSNGIPASILIINVPDGASYLMLVLRNDGETTYANPMLNAGSTALPWEPYTDGIPSPSPGYSQEIVTAGSDGSIDITVSDGVDQSQQLSIQTPNGLPGIPVDSGGNFTDADGQQWVCDVVDFQRGVYVQRIQKILGYSDENVLSPYMSTTGQLTTGATVIYVLAAPIETPLSDEELTAYAALMSYDGSTVISTDEDVSGISAKVVTDVISKNAWFDPYAELSLYYKALAGFESLDNLPMPHSRESSLVRKLLDSSYELGFTVSETSSRNERYLWDLINGTTLMLTNVPKSDTEKFLHVMIGGTVEEYPTVDTELDYWMDKCVNYMNSNGSIGG